MSLNIKNEKTHRLVRELARVTGESMTAAVDGAAQERLERVRRTKNGGLA
jgi:antitoxin VapB